MESTTTKKSTATKAAATNSTGTKAAAKKTAVKKADPARRRPPAKPTPVEIAELEPLAEAADEETWTDLDGEQDLSGPEGQDEEFDYEYDDEPGYPIAASPHPRRPRRLLVVAAVLVVLFAAAAVFEYTQANDKSNQLSTATALRAGAIKAANTYGVYLSSYNYANLNGPTAPWTEVDDHATASFKQQFDATKSSLSTLVTTYKATASGKVLSVGLESVDATNATALVFVDQTITNTTSKSGPTTQPLRVEVDLVRSHGQWLINQVQVPK